MILIKPSQISGEIMTLIEEADKKLIIVSPYCNFSDWTKFRNTIDFLKRKEIPVEFYVREGQSKTVDQVVNIGFAPIEVKNLHTKLYINESYAIVSSMNLISYSDANSLDIAYKTESKEEYDELIAYYNRYLSPFNKEINRSPYSKEKHEDLIKNGNLVSYLSNLISTELDSYCKIKYDENGLYINCNNNYTAFISNKRKDNYLNIYGIVSSKEAEILNDEKKRFKEKSNLDIIIQEPNNQIGYNSVWHHSKIELKSKNIDKVYKEDYNIIVQVILDFVLTLQDFKSHCRETSFK